MNRTRAATLCVTMFLALLAGVAAAEKYSGMTNEELSRLHSTTSKENKDFELLNTEWQKRLSTMSAQERQHFMTNTATQKDRESFHGNGVLMGAGYERQQGVGLHGAFFKGTATQQRTPDQ